MRKKERKEQTNIQTNETERTKKQTQTLDEADFILLFLVQEFQSSILSPKIPYLDRGFLFVSEYISMYTYEAMELS